MVVVRDWFAGTWAVFLKDVRLELRTRYGLNALAMFVASSLFLTAVSFGQLGPEPRLAAALIWIVIVFAAAVGLGRAFVSEHERGTSLLLRLHLAPGAVYTGKLLFNVVLVGAMNLLALLGFLLILGLRVVAADLLGLTLVLGSIGLAGAMTLLSAIVARAGAGGPLLAVLAFPVLIPLLLSVARTTHRALLVGPGPNPWLASVDDLVALFAYAGAVITASALLFEYVWRD